MKTRNVALAVLLALTLTGCAGGSDDAADERTAPAVSESAAPLAAEEPSEDDADDTESAYLIAVRETLPASTQIPDASDEQLLAVGEEVCTRVAAGESLDGVSLIEGEQPNGIGGYDDTNMIIVAAKQYLCA